MPFQVARAAQEAADRCLAKLLAADKDKGTGSSLDHERTATGKAKSKATTKGSNGANGNGANASGCKGGKVKGGKGKGKGAKDKGANGKGAKDKGGTKKRSLK